MLWAIPLCLSIWPMTHVPLSALDSDCGSVIRLVINNQWRRQEKDKGASRPPPSQSWNFLPKCNRTINNTDFVMNCGYNVYYWILSTCLRLLGASFQTLTGAMPWFPLGLFCPQTLFVPLSNSRVPSANRCQWTGAYALKCGKGAGYTFSNVFKY